MSPGRKENLVLDIKECVELWERIDTLLVTLKHFLIRLLNVTLSKEPFKIYITAKKQ